MLSRNQLLTGGSVALAAVAIAYFGAYQADAQNAPAVAREVPAKVVTLTGRVVDLHCAMTGKSKGADLAKCARECLAAGVPAALESQSGLIVLGHGDKGPNKLVQEFAHERVTVTGTLYDKGGIKYLDIETIRQPLTDEIDAEDADAEGPMD